MVPLGRIERPYPAYKAGPLTFKATEAYGRDCEIRTRDPLIPNQVLYQAEPSPDMLFDLTFINTYV